MLEDSRIRWFGPQDDPRISRLRSRTDSITVLFLIDVGSDAGADLQVPGYFMFVNLREDATRPSIAKVRPCSPAAGYDPGSCEASVNSRNSPVTRYETCSPMSTA